MVRHPHVPLCSGWSLWSWACLRATGFPARLLGELADDELAATADRWLVHDADVTTRREALLAECTAAVERGTMEERSWAQSAVKQLGQLRVPGPIANVSAEAARQQLAEATTRLDALTRGLKDQYTRARRVTSQVLRRFGEDDRFRQALLWQNRTAVRTGVDSLARRPIDASDSKTRQYERLVASYVQRYCAKNDTIGFFGPVGWARFVERPVVVAQRPGPSLLASHTVYYEHWAIDALAAKLSAAPELRPFIAPRLLPRYRLEGTTLFHPVGRRAELPAELAAVVARCDGVRRARDIARDVARDPELGLGAEAEVFALLDELAESRVITWALEIPTAGAHPDRHLAALLERIDDAGVRDRAEAVLANLDRHRAAVAASANATQLEASLTAFDVAFREATGTESQRAHGQTYAARTPLYEECRRDLDVELGRPFLDRLGPPLALVLQSARWFTHEIATRYRRRLGEIHRRLRDSDGDPVIDFAQFWQEVPALFPGSGATGSIVGDVRDELHRRWAAVLAIASAERSVQRHAAALTDEVQRTFAAPCPGWPAARHHSPDLMIAANGPDALARGELEIVLGELHSGFNTVAVPLFLKEHPSPEELVAARDADLDRVCVAPVWSRAVTRADYYSVSPRDLDLENGDTRSARPRQQVLSTGELVVGERDGTLEVRTRDGRWSFDVIAFLEHHLIAESFAAFSLVAPAAWTPRVTIDHVVIARATWRVARADVAWTELKDPDARFAAARRWARALGMPRWMFVKTPEEVKPVYVDLDSPVFVEMLAKQLRDASSASLSEMLPTAEDAWVIDGAGSRYTGELRIAAVDPEPWRPARDT